MLKGNIFLIQIARKSVYKILFILLPKKKKKRGENNKKSKHWISNKIFAPVRLTETIYYVPSKKRTVAPATTTAPEKTHTNHNPPVQMCELSTGKQ